MNRRPMLNCVNLLNIMPQLLQMVVLVLVKVAKKRWFRRDKKSLIHGFLNGEKEVSHNQRVVYSF